MSYTYDYPRPALTVDIIVLNTNNNQNYLLLIERKNEPFKNCWALPGGFVDQNEDLHASAVRELKEETNLNIQNLNQFKTYGTPKRDPRGHTVSVVYYSKNNNLKQTALAGDDAKNLKWFNLNNLPELAFDHKKIITDFFKEHKFK